MSKQSNAGKHQPAGLRGEVNVSLHTTQAQSVFKGRDKTNDKPAIIGLVRFAGAATQIFHCAKADDPWADWWLIKIDDAIEHAKLKFTVYEDELKNLLPQTSDINIASVTNSEPLVKPLQFPNPYAYRMGFLVVDYDKYCCEVLKLRHIGLLGREKAERYLSLGGKAVRAALASATGYRYQGVTRNDVLAKNPRARKSVELMGQVPDDIFNLKRRSEFAPDLHQYKSENIVSSEAVKVESPSGVSVA